MKGFYISILIFLLMVTESCVKKNNPPGPTTEPSIVFSVNASATNTSLAATFPVTVSLNSALPSPSGISVVATVLSQATSASIPQNNAVTSTTAVNNIQLINLPRQQWCTVTIKVSSVATPTNSASRTFDVVYK